MTNLRKIFALLFILVSSKTYAEGADTLYLIGNDSLPVRLYAPNNTSYECNNQVSFFNSRTFTLSKVFSGDTSKRDYQLHFNYDYPMQKFFSSIDKKTILKKIECLEKNVKKRGGIKSVCTRSKCL